MGPNGAFHERQANAMAELDVVEAEIDDLPEHLFAVLMAMGIPASGKGKHYEDFFR
jgi:hypothetical protein